MLGPSRTLGPKLAAPILVLGAMLIFVDPTGVFGALFASLALPALFVRRGLSVSRTTQSLLALVALSIGLLVPRPMLDPNRVVEGLLSAQAFPFAAAALLVATSRLYFVEPAGGTPLTIAIALMGMTSCGRTRTGLVYVAAVALFLLASVIALRASDAARPRVSRLGKRHVIGVLVALVAIGLSATAGAMFLPQAHAWAMDRILEGISRRTGFSDVMRLDSLRGMLVSDEVVMRVRGARVDHLRGAVYTAYQRGQWARELDRNERELAISFQPLDAPDATEIEMVGREKRYFAPLDTGAIGVSTGVARVDDLGVLKLSADGERAKRISFRPGPMRVPAVGPPEIVDRLLPASLARSLVPLAKSWTEGATSHREELIAIEGHLQRDFTYSLEAQPEADGDPTQDFLFRRKTGHCEYFATSMALLGRAIGIPTRVVGGYRVSERNPLGDYYIVRERNAHAWVEAWIEGEGWQTFDPTPPDESFVAAGLDTPIAAAVFDLIGTTWEAFDDWLAERTAEQLIVVLLALMALLPLVRWLRERQKKAAMTTKGGHRVEPPLPCFVELSRALGARGVTRADSEPIERFAERLLGPEGSLLGEGRVAISLLLKRYAALRYGGSGDEGPLAEAMRAAARSLKASK